MHTVLARTHYDPIIWAHDVKVEEDRGVYYDRGEVDFVLPLFASAFSDFKRVVLSSDA